MNRRSFLRMLGVGAGIAVAAPYVPAKLFFDMGNLKRAQTLRIVDYRTDFEWDSVEAALMQEDVIRDRYIIPAMKQIAREIDIRAFQQFGGSSLFTVGDTVRIG